MVIKLVVEEYINHISPFHFQFRAEPAPFYRSKWYRTNWITLEFNLLYRWHSLVPDRYMIGDRVLPLDRTIFNNEVLIDDGIAAMTAAASRQKAGRLALFNSPPYLARYAELKSVLLGRAARLKSYNDYREYCGYPKVTRFDQITGDVWLQCELKRLYGSPDKLELFVGLFAEEVESGSALPPLIGRMVAIDAFSQALTNPLLSERVYNRDTFAEGWDEIEKTKSLGDVLARNTPEVPEDRKPALVTMTQK